MLARCVPLAALSALALLSAVRADVSLLDPADAARYRAVRPGPGELKWRQVPWMTDLAEGVRRAHFEGRPVLLWISGDDPLERC